MTSAWQYPVHMHPWFRMPSLKRKAYQRENSSSSSSDSSDYESCSPAKRLRCNVLESSLAQLSLNASQEASHTSQDPFAPPHGLSSVVRLIPHPNTITATVERDIVDSVWEDDPASSMSDPPRSVAVVFPGSVEEPTSPELRGDDELPDVTMKSRSWYEPEKDRIVVVDLDDSDEEGTPDDSPQVTVNSALLERIHGQRVRGLSETPVVLQSSASSQALVLFRPLHVSDGRQQTLDSGVRLGSCAQNEFDSGTKKDNSEDVDIRIEHFPAVDVYPVPMDVDDAMDVE